MGRPSHRAAPPWRPAAPRLLEPLEPRVLLAADLAGYVGAVQLPPQLAAGLARGRVQVVIDNDGDSRAKGQATVRAYLSADGVLDAGDILVGQAAKSLNLIGGGETTCFVPVAVPAATPEGDYRLLATVDPGPAIADGDLTNNTDVGDGTYHVAPPHVTLAGAFDLLNLADKVVPGTRGSATVRVANRGNIPSHALFGITLFLSSDQVLDDADAAIGALPGRGPLLAAGGETAYRVNLAVPAGAAVGDYYVLGVIDRADTPAGSPDDRATFVCAALLKVVAPVTDLSARFDSVDLFPELWPGDKGQVKVAVKNEGNVPVSGAASVGVYLSPSGALDASAVRIGGLPAARLNLRPGYATSLKIATTVPQSIADGEYTLVAAVDAGPAFVEADANNNIAAAGFTCTVSARAPDVALSFVDPSPLAPGGVEIAAGMQAAVPISLSNNGNVCLAGATVDLYLSADGVLGPSDIRIGTLTILDRFWPGQILDKEVKAAVPAGIRRGTYQLLAVAAPKPGLIDVNPQDNTFLLPDAFDVVSPVADLTGMMGGLTLNDDGQTGVVNLTVQNAGNLAVNKDIRVRAYLSQTGTLAGAVAIGTAWDGRLAPGDSHDCQIYANIPDTLAAGDYFVLAQIDAGNAVAEADETNNLLVSDAPITYQVAAVFAGDRIDNPLGVRAVPGDSARMTLWLGNQGRTALNGPITVKLYLQPWGDETLPWTLIGTARTTLTDLQPGQGDAVVTVAAVIPRGQKPAWYDLTAVIVPAPGAGTGPLTASYFMAGDASLEIAAPGPDLSAVVDVPGVASVVAGGQTGRAQVSLVNSGSVPLSGSVDVDVCLQSYDPADPEIFLGRTAVDMAGLAPHQKLSVGVDLAVPAGLTLGTRYSLVAVADATGKVAEVDELNNEYPYGDVQVVAPGYRNLTGYLDAPWQTGCLSSDWYNTSRLAPGQSTNGTLTLRNEGVVPLAGTVQVQVYLTPASLGDTAGPTSVLIGSALADVALEPGQSQDVAIRLVVTGAALPGDYNVVTVIDPQGAIPDDKPADNVIGSGWHTVSW